MATLIVYVILLCISTLQLINIHQRLHYLHDIIWVFKEKNPKWFPIIYLRLQHSNI